ncbi:cytochrome c oxidase subunit 5B, mitochondrial-like [Leptopilina heterotoma]|uniref:cytochrome c oxidase subunit 5B, mitochondrial-like n=1 Tax=Leptopilina heterotoma TaxID=63436 RepID=UPI001CA97572|nr:cytochrome c oxidase subunit 5B, mitochondrial-like [Leptopilina heterotoma]
MASICGRLILRNTRREFSTKTPCLSGWFWGPKYMPDPVEHAQGLEKKELLAHLSGNDDPFMSKALIRHDNSKDRPIMVPSAFDSRMIGCICEEDQTYICWMWLHAGNPRRCECGHWFKLQKKTPITAD